MKMPLLKYGIIAVSCAALLGCHRHEDGDHHHDDVETGEIQGHGDDAKSFSGATHKEGEGITLLPQTKEHLGIQLADAQERSVSNEVTFSTRVFAFEANTNFLASAMVPDQNAKLLSPGTPLTLRSAGGDSFDGAVAKVANAVSPDETEIIVRFASESPSVGVGSFLRATASISVEAPVMTVPKEAVIRGATESFVYVQNGDAYLRTTVETGREARDKVEIKEGLLEGDAVVSKGAMDLWLVELRAVKGGQGCCPAPPTKGKRK